MLLLGGGGAAVGATPTSATATGNGSASVLATKQAEQIRATDAPTRVHVRAAQQRVVITVVTDQRMDGTGVALTDRQGRVIANGSSTTLHWGRPTVQKVGVNLRARSLTHWGQQTWKVDAWRTSDGSCTLLDRQVTVDIRAHSSLRLSASRRGDAVQVSGTAQAFHSTAGRFVPWTGRPASLQRLVNGRWTQVAALRTDSKGKVSHHLNLPKGAQLRLVTSDTASIWGGTTRPVTT
ncbi:hypothetical protein [Pseudokineococcus sp. 1T1Z-3]|uniref:hypothetical protein n=1 Tax=Pseudokineococcus sp. 1T1Z-3 TaxID=3132745 RepID=UPI0030B76355